MRGWSGWPRRRAGAALILAVVLTTDTALAHGGSLRGASQSVAAPTWLVVLTGGGVVAGSFLLATFVTDRGFVAAAHEWHLRLDGIGRPDASAATDAQASVGRAHGTFGRAFGVAVLAAVVLAGFFGPADPLANLAILVVWVGWWSGFTATTYLLGNTWPTLNPWRAIASWASLDGVRSYPDRLGAWPAVVGLLVLVWIEVVGPLADEPPLLAIAVVGYSVVAIAGATTFGVERWFSTADPISRTFATYGRLGPLTRGDDGRLEIRLPGSGLTAPVSRESGAVAFVLALLWATTFDGLVATPEWALVVEFFVGVGVPPLVVYLAGMVGGFGLFYGAFLAAARRSRTAADTYLTPTCIARWFAPSLVPIAAGYHLAHFLGYFLSLAPALAGVVAPFGTSTATATVLVLPDWFGGLELWFVLLGHLVAVAVAHATAYRLFPGRLQAVRSQYPFVAAMVVYTSVSLWIVSRPTVSPPFL